MSKKLNSRKNIRYHLVRLLLSIAAIVVVSIITWQVIPMYHPTLGCANSISCTKELTGHIEKGAVGIFEDKKVIPPSVVFASNTTQAVLGATLPPGEKHIYVDLSTQTLYAYQGKNIVMRTLISSGKWHPTPTGDFSIWIKLRATRMTGGTGDDFYDLPNVPFVMYFYNDEVPKSSGFSLHGAYWHSNFGHPMSHGCVNMRITDAEALYNWVDPPTDGLITYATIDHPGTKVTITGTAPGF